jgi:hypothetical protein
MMNGCGKYEYLLVRFIHGEILLSERKELENHLAVCSSCERLYAEIAAFDRLLRDMPDKLMDPPPYLRARILANLPEEKAAPLAARWGKWAAVVGASAACALMAFVLFRAGAPRETRVASVPSPSAGSGVTAPAPVVPAPAPSPQAGPPAASRPESVASAPPVRVIREVRIYFYYPPAEKVAVTGDFNGWDRDGVPLKRAGKPGLWETSLRLKPGAYSYNFIVDGEVLVPDPNSPNQMPDGYGGTNSIMLVKGENPV